MSVDAIIKVKEAEERAKEMIESAKKEAERIIIEAEEIRRHSIRRSQ